MSSDFAPDVQRLIAQELSLGSYSDEQDVLRHALVALAEQRETLAGIERGLADVAAGRVKSREEFEADFRARHKLPDAE
jgi:predicted transcriptional regulator